MASKCPKILAAVIARDAKKMELQAAIERVQMLREEYNERIQAVKNVKELFKSGKAKAGPRCYKDNPANRKLGRVGKPIPSKKGKKKKATASDAAGGSASDGSANEAKATPQRFYKDNDANRKLGRVGKLIPSRKGKKKTKKVESKALVKVESPKAVATAAEPEDDEKDVFNLSSSSASDSDSDSSSDDGF